MPNPQESISLIPEMAALPSSWLPDTAVGADEAQDAAFAALWAQQRGDVAKSINAEQVVGLSRWAKEQMRGYALPGDWIATLQLAPLFGTQSGQSVVFGTRHNNALKLPTHSQAVDRRLFVYAEYSHSQGKIVQVVVTIRGTLDE